MKPVMTRGKWVWIYWCSAGLLLVPFKPSSLSRVGQVASALGEGEALGERVGPLQAPGRYPALRRIPSASAAVLWVCSGGEWDISLQEEKYCHRTTYVH